MKVAACVAAGCACGEAEAACGDCAHAVPTARHTNNSKPVSVFMQAPRPCKSRNLQEKRAENAVRLLAPWRGGTGGYDDGMSKLLLNLRNVPDDEAADVRALLDAKRIAFHETPPSPWGISFGGIWVTDDADFPEARQAFDEYERERSIRVRAEYAAAKRAGTADTFVSVLRADPLRVVIALLGILLALGLVALPVVLLHG